MEATEGKAKSRKNIDGAWNMEALRALTKQDAIDWLESQNPEESVFKIWQCHALEYFYYLSAREKDDLKLHQLALQAAKTGLDLANSEGLYPLHVASMALNYIGNAGHLKIDIRDQLPVLRYVVLKVGNEDKLGQRWWNVNFYYFLNLHILDTAQACLDQYRLHDNHDQNEAKHMMACLSAVSGKGISELARLRNKAAEELTGLIDMNIKFITSPEFRPAQQPDWRDYKPRGQEWFDYVLDRNMDALALALDVLHDCGDPRLALAVESLRQCNSVLDQAAMQELGELEDDEDLPLELD